MNHPRPLVSQSWTRMVHARMPVDLPAPDIDPDSVTRATEILKATAEIDLTKVIKFLDYELQPLLAHTDLLGVFTTSDTRVAQQFGTTAARRRAHQLGFIRGARWSENTVGTNAIGTAAVVKHAVQIHGPEHWCLSQHDWSCSAAPILDPRTGQLLGILDISGPIRQAHPALLGMVHAITREVELTIRETHLNQLEQLRSAQLPTLYRTSHPWVLTDEWGWVAATSQTGTEHSSGRITLPADVREGTVFIEEFGAVNAQQISKGWLLWLEPADSVSYTLNRTRKQMVIDSRGINNTLKLSPKHTAILDYLAHTGIPCTLEDISCAIWGKEKPTSTVRAEMSRLRKRFPELVSPAPYQLLQELAIVEEN